MYVCTRSLISWTDLTEKKKENISADRNAARGHWFDVENHPPTFRTETEQCNVNRNAQMLMFSKCKNLSMIKADV